MRPVARSVPRFAAARTGLRRNPPPARVCPGGAVCVRSSGSLAEPPDRSGRVGGCSRRGPARAGWVGPCSSGWAALSRPCTGSAGLGAPSRALPRRARLERGALVGGCEVGARVLPQSDRAVGPRPAVPGPGTWRPWGRPPGRPRIATSAVSPPRSRTAGWRSPFRVQSDRGSQLRRSGGIELATSRIQLPQSPPGSPGT